MGAIVGYLRVSTDDQQTGSQKSEIESRYSVDRWFEDAAVSGVVKTEKREGFSNLMNYVREGDTLVVYAIDRLGRDTIDVLNTVESLHAKGVAVISIREGFELGTPIGKAMLTMLAAIAELERSNIKARQMAGIARAKKDGLQFGREKVIDDRAVALWRSQNKQSIAKTAKHFGISTPSVKRACRKAAEEGWLDEANLQMSKQAS
ncbi:recombinase family protein [Halomonas sp. XH26]|uniref:Recombinase family protein n=2 Tax=Halomonadaceae TaxID=28256 RepID=A0AAJ2VP09_9GAMM|nr:MULTISPECIES: recombinase family protein [Halomonas]MDX5976214.1 recombinase family protein [Halomonas alkaliphila]UTA78262.1 recombinase family protein [Halomonas sp. XH26]UYV17618.1 recombinase family protein [Halomonas qaidamensis]